MEKFDMQAMAARIRAARTENRMSLANLAAVSGFTKSHIWDLETGRALNPTVNAVWAIAAGLKVSPSWLMFGDTIVDTLIEQGRREERADVVAKLTGSDGTIPLLSIFAPLVSGNSQPCMSGDPRERLTPYRRRAFDDAAREIADAILQAQQP